MPRIYNDDGTFEDVEHINWYLLAGPDIYAEPRSTPICPVPRMFLGNKPSDGGNLILSEDERDKILKKYPNAEKFIKVYLNADDFLNGKQRYCLWLVDASPIEIKSCPPIYERVKKVQAFRKKSSAAPTRKTAETPHKFFFVSQPKNNYILIPSTTSENRKYIPIDFVSPEIISSNANYIIPDAELWHFGILTSSVHMAWTKTVCGRLESRYRYSAKLVYNNFVWQKMTRDEYNRLNITAQKILDVRKKYPGASLASLYDEVTMPKDLRAAHRDNDKIVMKIYGFDESMTDEEIAIQLLMRYDELKNYLESR